jgi:hydroxymethylpyrimidine pyrophosphatase-like HAD family hydrolase
MLNPDSVDRQLDEDVSPAGGLTANSSATLLPTRPLDSETEFYSEYPWSLNMLPKFGEMLRYLSRELERLDNIQRDWRCSEVWTNIFLLTGTITNTVDDLLLGDYYDLSKIAASLPVPGLAIRLGNKVLDIPGAVRTQRLRGLRSWRDKWAAVVDDFLTQSFEDGRLIPSVDSRTKGRCLDLLAAGLPSKLLQQRPRIPAYFRSRDFTHFDCIQQGLKFVNAYSELARPVQVAGLRTAGSYLAPLLCALLRSRGYQDVDWVTFRPRKFLGEFEKAKLLRARRKGARVLIVDEPVLSGTTLAKTVSILRGMGFSDGDIVELLPIDPACPDWRDSPYIQAVSKIGAIPLEPAERYKQELLDSAKVEPLLNEYFRNLGYDSAKVVSSPRVEAMNFEWKNRPAEKIDSRLKRVFEVQLCGPSGSEIRYVFAKSVGWGWMGYHAFLAGQQLSGFVPPILGQRDGILYAEWLPQDSEGAVSKLDRGRLVNFLADYVVTRSRSLTFESDPSPALIRDGEHKSFEHLAGILNRAYNSRAIGALQRPRIRQRLSRQITPAPNLTDSRMAAGEWIRFGSQLLKTDFEHHCQGKNETYSTDPAYDLADAILQFGLSQEEAARLVDRYSEETGDEISERRLFFNKLAVGTWSQHKALGGLSGPRQLRHQAELNQQYIDAWNFLVTETVRECGKLCQPRNAIQWQEPIIILDIDGVLDRMVFSFPSTTAAGIRAVSLFHAHGFTVALDTARTLREVKEYCRAYGFAGGVAEYGSVAWDSVSGCARPLISRESLDQIAKVRNALQNMPGIFLNENYEYSLRAFTYQPQRMAPLPPLLAENLIARLNADRLQIHHTGLDTAILAKEVDKGTGLLGLLDLVGMPKAKTVAIGDSEADLPMFHVSSQSFAPSQVSCANLARLFGCQISDNPAQVGLFSIARKIAHPDGRTCDRCQEVDRFWPKEKDLFVELLETADQKRLPILLRSLFKPSALLSLLKK